MIAETFIGDEQTPAQVAQACRDKPDKKAEFEHARRVLQQQKRAEFGRTQVVSSTTFVGIQVEEARAFVTANIFENYMKIAIKALGLPLVQVQDVEGITREGVLLQLHGLPDDLPWSRVTAFSRTETEIKEVMLGPGEALRAGHADSLWKHYSKGGVAQRPTHLRSANIGKLPTFASTFAKKEDIQRKLQEKEAEHERRQAAADAAALQGLSGNEVSQAAAAAMNRHSASRLSGPVSSVAAPPAQAAKRKPSLGAQASSFMAPPLSGVKRRKSGAACPGSPPTAVGGGGSCELRVGGSRAGVSRWGGSAASDSGYVDALAEALDMKGDGDRGKGGGSRAGLSRSAVPTNPSARASADRLNIERVLAGYSPGRELGSLEGTLKKYQEQRLMAEALELETHIAAAHAAVTWQIPSILKSTTTSAQLQLDWSTLTDDGHTLGHEAMWTYTRKLAEEYAERGQIKQFMECVWPLCVPDGQDTPLWTASEPSFLAAPLPADAVEGTAQQKVMGELWMDAVISNHLLRVVSDAEGPHGTAKLLELVRGILEAGPASLPELPEHGIEYVRSTVSMLRALLALCDPSPGLCGASPTDVEFIAPVNPKRNKKSEDDESGIGLRKGKALLRMVAREGVWRDRVASYRRFSGAERERGGELRELASALQKTLDEEPYDFEAASTTLDRAVEQLPDLRQDFRPGACNKVEDLAWRVLSKQWGVINPGPSAKLPILLHLEKQLEALLGDGLADAIRKEVVPLKLDVHNLAMQWTDEEQLGALRMATELSLLTADEVSRYLWTLKQAINIDKPTDMLQLMATNVDFVCKFLWTTCAREDAVMSDLNDSLELLQLLGAQCRVSTLAAARPAQHLMSWRGALQRLAANTDDAAIFANAVVLHEHMLSDVNNRDAQLGSGAADEPEAVAIWGGKILDLAADRLQTASKELEGPARAYVQTRLQALSKATLAMEPKAGGMDAVGKHWADGFAAGGDILKVFADTLDKTEKMAAADFERRLKDLSKTYDEHTSAAAKYRTYCAYGEEARATRERDETARLEKAQKILLVANTTRLEVFIGRAMLHGKAKKKTILKSKEDFESKMNKNPARHVHPELWKLADKELMAT